MVKKISKFLPIIALAFPNSVLAAGIIDFSGATPQYVGDLLVFIIGIKSFILGAAGAVAAVMIVYGAFLYITAGGNDEKLAKAKNTLLWAIAGIALIAAAEVLVTLFISILGAKK